jgi:glycerol uptake facilitator-like aquaporin
VDPSRPVAFPLRLRLLAEAAGTWALVGLGTAAIVAGARAGGVPQWELAVAWFFALAIPAMALSRVSGGHFNPAITFGLWLGRAHPRSEVVPYVLAQFAGAFLGSATVWLLLGNGAHLGATLPADGNLGRTFAYELLFTAALGASIAVGLRWRSRLGRWAPLLPSAVVGLATLTIGPITGSSLNVARTLAPAVLSGSYEGLWIYLIAIPIGASLGIVPLLALVRAPPRPAEPEGDGEGEGSAGAPVDPSEDRASAYRCQVGPPYPSGSLGGFGPP